MSQQLIDQLQSPGPKRILALDGGGIRGAITLGYLEEIESILRKRHNKPDLRLCEYYDLIGGTSTGAIIAACLAVGMTVGEIKTLYLKLGKKIFGEKRGLFKRLSAKFKIKALEKQLNRIFSETRLGDEAIKTGLCIVTKRADTGSTWPLINHPNGKYYDENKDILLRKAVRASTAAPTYFKPEIFDVGNGQVGAFVDGGVSMHNNPSLQLFFVATLKGFPFHWKMGADQLLLTSIGTGFWRNRTSIEEIEDHKLWNWASDVISMLMKDASQLNEIIMQFLSVSPTNRMIDTEIENLKDDLIHNMAALHYLRYNATLERQNLDEMGFPDIDPEKLYEMSAAENCAVLAEIGEVYARQQVMESHFPTAFDLQKNTFADD